MSAVFSDPYAEIEVLGSLLDDPQMGMVVARGDDLVRPTDFHNLRHRVIAEAMWTLDDNNRAINTTSLASQLRQTGLLNDVGGLAYLEELASYSGSLRDAAERVVKTAQRRELNGLGGIVQTMAQSEDTDVENIFEELEDRTYNIRTRGNGELKTIGDLIPDWWDSITSGGTGYNVGVSWFDDLKQQIDSNDFILIAGRPGDGKSTLLRYLTYLVAVLPPPEQRKGVYIGDFEEGFGAWTVKLVSVMSGINSSQIATNNLNDEQRENVTRCLSVLRRSPIIIDCTSGLTLQKYKDRVRASKRNIERTFNVPMGFHAADYVQRMHGPESSAVTKNTNISHGLRDLCQPNELDIPCISTAQLSRAPVSGGTMREYALSDLRETGALEQDATSVIFIVRDWLLRSPSAAVVNQFPENRDRDPDTEQWLAEVVHLKFAKNRGKPTGSSQSLAWRKWCGRYEAL